MAIGTLNRVPAYKEQLKKAGDKDDPDYILDKGTQDHSDIVDNTPQPSENE